MEARLARQTQELVRDETIHLTDALPATNAHDGSDRSSYHYELAVWETTCIISTAANAFTVYMPPVSEAKGKIYCITMVASDQTVTVDDNEGGDSEDFGGGSAISLNAAYDRVALYSDGSHWFTVSDMFT